MIAPEHGAAVDTLGKTVKVFRPYAHVTTVRAFYFDAPHNIFVNALSFGATVMKFCLISQLILNVTGLLSFLILILLWSSSFPNVEEGAGEGVGGPWRLEARSIAFLVISVTMVVLLSLNSLCLFDLVYRWRSDCECPRTKSLLSVLRGGRKTEPADELFFHQEDRLVRDSPTISGKDLTVVKLLHPTREEIFLSSTNESLDKAIGQVAGTATDKEAFVTATGGHANNSSLR